VNREQQLQVLHDAERPARHRGVSPERRPEGIPAVPQGIRAEKPWDLHTGKRKRLSSPCGRGRTYRGVV
jgi:hypothetical protein